MIKNQAKSQLRKRMLAKAASLTEDEAIRRSKNAEIRLSKLSLYKEAKTIVFYYPIKGELDLRRMLRKALVKKKVCLPFTDLANKRLRIYHVQDLDRDLAKGTFGIKEPRGEKIKEVDVREIDLVIVPGLAFDRQKNRLGRGGGFYDRFLKEIPDSAKKIGAAFDFQVTESLPVNLSQDQKVDLIVTDSRVIE